MSGKGKPLDDLLQALLYDQDWDAITLTLARYAASVVNRRHWRRFGGRGDLPKGKTTEDIAYDSIAAVITGTLEGGPRAWDPNKNPDLLHHLKGVVDSQVWTLLKSADHRKRRAPPPAPDGRTDDEVEVLATKGHSDLTAHSPEDYLCEQELQKQILAVCTGDDELELLACALLEGHELPRDIAAATGLPVERVYKVRQKLRTRLEETRTQPIATSPRMDSKGDEHA